MCGLATVAAASEEALPLAGRHWFEARTTDFHTYSCGPTQEVARVAARLEQFHRAYAALAGAQAVASPPIVVMAFPDHASLEYFLPQYKGKPANLAGFFLRSSDENLIVLSLERQSSALQTILHEYAHLLLRRNENIWPLWLDEGMADIYSTFEVTGNHTVRIGSPIESYEQILSRNSWMPLEKLFAVTHKSPEYNERDRQSIFYAESWLLTHYLMCGAGPAYRAQFGAMTGLLRQGEGAVEAFTNSFRLSLPLIEAQLHAYLQSGQLPSQPLTVSASLMAPQPLTFRALTPVERLFHLGDELLRLRRFSAAARYFGEAKVLAPASSLGYVGLGLLAAERSEPEAAVRQLREGLRRGSESFLAHFVYAREKFSLAAGSQEVFHKVAPAEAAEIRTELERSLGLMPQFGPAHHLLGVLELVQGDSVAAAEEQLEAALQLEPENEGYALTLAQAQVLAKTPEAARRTLEPLCRPHVEKDIRLRAQRLLEEVRRQDPS